MASAFGGQRSIQLSYGCLGRGYRPSSPAPQSEICLAKEIVAELERTDKRIDLGLGIVERE